MLLCDNKIELTSEDSPSFQLDTTQKPHRFFSARQKSHKILSEYLQEEKQNSPALKATVCNICTLTNTPQQKTLLWRVEFCS